MEVDVISGAGWRALYAVRDEDGAWDGRTATLVPVIAWEETSGAHQGFPRIAGWVIPLGHSEHEAAELAHANAITLRIEDGRVATFVRYVADTWRPEDGI